MEQLLEILKKIKPGVDFEKETALYDDGIIDSLDVITIISEVNDEFDVSVPAEEIVPENFNSTKAMLALIERLEDE
jgi:D-alanine--poly(phosphoribitol) ligase subunit 2